MRKVFGVILLAGCLALLWGLWPTQPEQTPPPANAMRVLFVGNSHNYFNDMPKMVVELAAAAGVDSRIVRFQDIVGGGPTPAARP